MKRPASFALFTSVLFSACAGRGGATGRSPSTKDDQGLVVCAVVAAVLDSLMHSGVTGELVFAPASVAYKDGTYLPEFLAQLQATPGLAESTWSNFMIENAEPHATCATLPDGRKLTRERWEGGNDPNSWDTFRRRHPNASGYAKLSGVGISASQDQAFVLLMIVYHSNGAVRYHVTVAPREVGRTWRVIQIAEENLGT